MIEDIRTCLPASFLSKLTRLSTSITTRREEKASHSSRLPTYSLWPFSSLVRGELLATLHHHPRLTTTTTIVPTEDFRQFFNAHRLAVQPA